MTEGHTIVAVFSLMVRVVGSIFILAGICVFGFQVYTWFNVGHWFEMDLQWFVHWCLSIEAMDFNSSPVVNWFHAPQRWHGLHQILLLVLDLIPLFLFLAVIGAFLLAAVYRGEKERNQIIETVEREMRARVGDKYASKLK